MVDPDVPQSKSTSAVKWSDPLAMALGAKKDGNVMCAATSVKLMRCPAELYKGAVAEKTDGYVSKY